MDGDGGLEMVETGVNFGVILVNINNGLGKSSMIFSKGRFLRRGLVNILRVYIKRGNKTHITRGGGGRIYKVYIR